MPKFTHAERRQIRDRIIECRVKRFSRLESQAYIKSTNKLDVSIRQIDNIIHDLKRTAPRRLAKLRESRYEFIDEVFKTKDEIEQYMREVWTLYHHNTNDPILQLNCQKELHQLSITRANILDVLPHYTAMESTSITIGGNKETVSSHIQSSPSPDTRRGQAIF